jgi:DNA-binding transcriptional LysR family regulator
MLEANDQMLRLGADGPQPLRLGISVLFVKEFFRHQTSESRAGVVVNTDHSVGITKGLIDGYIDIACIYENPEIVADIADLVVKDSSELFGWVRSKNFVLSPGAPIPVLTWPGDDLMIRTLRKKGIPYKIVFNSPDYYAKLEALEAGIGIAAIPDRMIPPSLVWAKEYYLPELPPVRALLCARQELKSPQSAALLNKLTSLFFQNQ